MDFDPGIFCQLDPDFARLEPGFRIREKKRIRFITNLSEKNRIWIRPPRTGSESDPRARGNHIIDLNKCPFLQLYSVCCLEMENQLRLKRECKKLVLSTMISKFFLLFKRRIFF